MTHKRDAITVSLDGHGTRIGSPVGPQGFAMIDMSSSSSSSSPPSSPTSSPKNAALLKGTKKLSRNKVYSLGLACAVCWGIAAVMGKSSLGEIPALILLVVQLIFSNGLLLGLVLWLRPPFPARREMVIFALVGILQPGLSYALALIGLQMTNVTSETLIWSCETVMIIGLSWVILKEPAGVKLMLLSGLAVIGVIMVTVSGEDEGDGSHLGDFLIFLGVICSALDVVLTKGYVDRIDPLWAIALGQFTGLLFSFGLAIFASLALPEHFWGLGSHHHHGHRIHLAHSHHHLIRPPVVHGIVGPGGAAAVMPDITHPLMNLHDMAAATRVIPAVPTQPSITDPIAARNLLKKKDTIASSSSKDGPGSSINIDDFLDPEDRGPGGSEDDDEDDDSDVSSNSKGGDKASSESDNEPDSVALRAAADAEESREAAAAREPGGSKNNNGHDDDDDDISHGNNDDGAHHDAHRDADHDGIPDRDEEVAAAKAAAEEGKPRRLTSFSSISFRTWLLAGISGLLQHALPFWLYAIVLTNMPSNMAAFFLTLSPVFGIAGAWWCLGEQLQSGQIWGTLVILASITGVGSMYKE